MNKKIFLFILCIFLLLIIVNISIGSGSIKISFTDIVLSVFNDDNLTDLQKNIISNIRLPRIFLAIFVGAALSVSGALLQAVMQNPLADPGIIGVSSGASLSIMFILIIMPVYSSFLPVIAFFGGISATLLIYVLSWKDGISNIRLLLAGIAVNAMLGGASSLISVLNSEKIQSVILWLNGTFNGRTWVDVFTYIPYIVVGLIISFFCIRGCNLLQLGDEKAANLGLNISKTRVLLSLLGAFLASVSTAAVGVIGFIGLIVPHISRLLVGSDYKYLLPFSMINGATFLLLTDTLARTVVAPIELPVGTIMAVIGGPFFLYLLRQRGKQHA